MPKLIRNQLTVRQVAALNKPGHYADGRSLYLSISSGGQKSWVLRYTLGRKREMGLGPVHRVSLAQAREAADAAYVLIRAQIDPIDERAKRKAELASTVVRKHIRFEEALDAYLRYKDLKGRHATNVANPLYTYIVPVIGKLPIADITSRQIYDALTTKTKSGAALWDRGLGERTLPYLAGIFTYAIAKGWRNDPINPAQREQLKIIGLKAQKHEVVHFSACPYSRIPECWERLQAHTDTSMMALRWTILNAARPTEARCLRWSWIDTQDRVVTIPGAAMKGGRAHRIPYGQAAAELLGTMRTVRTCDWVFPADGDKPYSPTLFSKLARRVMPDIPGITIHGFRSSFSTWARERTVFEVEMIEVALAHQIGNKVSQAYDRGSMLAKRRTLMTTWADYCQGRGTTAQYRSEFIAVV